MVSGVLLGDDGVLGLQYYLAIDDEEGSKRVVAALASLARQLDGPPDVPGILAHSRITAEGIEPRGKTALD